MSRLTDFYYELAQKALNEAHPVEVLPAPLSPPCTSADVQDITKEPAGSPVDWATDPRQSCNLTDQEVLDKMQWQLRAINTCERLQRAFEVPTVYPEAK
jgi:hypothetical protein